MSALAVSAPFPTYPDINGDPLDNGSIYIGVAGLPAALNPINVYFDEALTQLAAQPIATRGGYPVNNGVRSRLFVNSDYSIQVLNSKGTMVYQALQSTDDFSNGIRILATGSSTAAGQVLGIKVGLADGTEPGWLLNPAAGDFVSIYPYISSGATRNRIWAINPIADISAGFPATTWAIEANVNVGTSNAPDPRTTNHALGVDVVSGGLFAPSAAFLTNSTTLANRWKHGLWFDKVGGQSGSTIIKTAVDVSVDYGIDFSSATVAYQAIRVGNTPALQIATVGARQLIDGQPALFLQRFTDSSPTGDIFRIVNAANNSILYNIDKDGNSISVGLSVAQFFTATASAGTVGANQISYGATVASSANTGSASALPALPLGYIIINVAGTAAKIPYYAN